MNNVSKYSLRYVATFILFGLLAMNPGKAQMKNSMLLNEQKQNGFWGDMGDGTYRNPILAADFSDPDPLRVGNDYYMVTSTFETSPGVTILRSKDLVNWKIIGGVFENLSLVHENFSHTKMQRYNQGVYAPSIRYHNGLFYVYVNLYTDGMFVATAQDPAGKWDVRPLKDKNGKPLILEGWTDPCPLWDDDGKVYLTSSNPGKNWFGYLFQMSSDGFQLLDADVDHMRIRNIIYEYPKGGTLYSRNYSTEGNKMYKRNGYYYIVHIEFLDGGNGAGTYIYRSKCIYGIKKDGTLGRPGDIGEYEIRRIDPHGSPYHQELPGQGGFVDTPDGRWFWIAQFNRYGSDGRTPCMVPVTWIDDWPVIGDSIEGNYGRMSWRRPKPILSSDSFLPHGSDDFLSFELNSHWAWNHQPDNNKWSLTERPGFLRLYAKPTADRTDSFFQAANTVEQRYMSSDTVVVTTKIDLSGMVDGQNAGMAHFNGGVNYALCGVIKDSMGIRMVYEKNKRKIYGPLLSLNTRTLYVRSVSGFEERNSNQQYTTEAQHFLYSMDGKKFVPFGEEYRMGTANFRGNMIGIYTYNNTMEKGYIDIDWFDYQVRNQIK